MNKRLKIGGGEADGSHFVARAMTGYSNNTGKDWDLRQRRVLLFRQRQRWKTANKAVVVALDNIWAWSLWQARSQSKLTNITSVKVLPLQWGSYETNQYVKYFIFIAVLPFNLMFNQNYIRFNCGGDSDTLHLYCFSCRPEEGHMIGRNMSMVSVL
jgi:hypothetical protein